MKPGASLLAASVLAAAGVARAEVALELEACSLSELALREHLSLELSTLGLERVASRLRLRCDGSLVNVELSQRSGERYPVELRLELRDTAKGERERLVALAASELIAQAERAERAASEAEPKAMPVAAPRPPEPAARPRRSRRHELSVAATLAFAGSEQTTLWGGALGARLGVERWSLLLDTRFERGEASLSLADVRWSSLSGFVGAGVGAGSPAYEVSAGLGVRAGWLVLDATARAPYSGVSLTAPWAGVALPLRAVVTAGARARPFVGLEGGYVFLPVRGWWSDGSASLAQRGPWVAASVGVGVSL